MSSRRLVALLAAVGDGDIDGIACQNDNAVGIDPEHYDEQRADGAIQDIVVVEVVDVYLERPRKAEDKQRGKQRPQREEVDALLLDG